MVVVEGKLNLKASVVQGGYRFHKLHVCDDEDGNGDDEMFI